MGIQRIEQFVQAVNTTDDSNIEILCKNELDYLRKAYNVSDYEINGVFSGLATYKAAITAYRKAVYMADNKSLALDHLKLSSDDTNRMVIQNGKSSMMNYKNRMNGEVYSIENPEMVIELSMELIHKSSYIDNILGLALLTGRRVNEIGHGSEFNLCEYDDVYKSYHMFSDIMDIETLDMVMVKGISKKQTYLNNKSGNDKAVIPVLCDPDTIINAMVDLRSRKSFTSPEDFHNKASKQLSEKVKKHYGEFKGITTSHDLRKAYIRIVYDMMINPGVKNDDGLNKFAEIALGQKIPDNYMKYI